MRVVAFAAVLAAVNAALWAGASTPAPKPSGLQKELDEAKETFRFDEWKEKLPGKKVKSLELSPQDFASYAAKTVDRLRKESANKMIILCDDQDKKIGRVDIHFYKSATEAREALLYDSVGTFAVVGFALPEKDSKYEIGDVSLCGTQGDPSNRREKKPTRTIIFIRNNVEVWVTCDESKVAELAKALDDKLVKALVDEKADVAEPETKSTPTQEGRQE
jgi:hypothetical protein